MCINTYYIYTFMYRWMCIWQPLQRLKPAILCLSLSLEYVCRWTCICQPLQRLKPVILWLSRSPEGEGGESAAGTRKAQIANNWVGIQRRPGPSGMEILSGRTILSGRNILSGRTILSGAILSGKTILSGAIGKTILSGTYKSIGPGHLSGHHECIGRWHPSGHCVHRLTVRLCESSHDPRIAQWAEFPMDRIISR